MKSKAQLVRIIAKGQLAILEDNKLLLSYQQAERTTGAMPGQYLPGNFLVIFR
jgi:hypothetical protein